MQVQDLTGVLRIATGTWHAVALMRDGTVEVWGSNYYGQLGDGTTQARLVPMPIPAPTGIARVIAGYDHTSALRSDE